MWLECDWLNPLFSTSELTELSYEIRFVRFFFYRLNDGVGPISVTNRVQHVGYRIMQPFGMRTNNQAESTASSRAAAYRQ